MVTPDFHVAMVSPEIAPFAKTGGLGDMMGALPEALGRLGVRLSLFMPAYRQVFSGGYRLEHTGLHLRISVSNRIEEADVLRIKTGTPVTLYLIRADRYFDRDGLYGTSEGDYPDNAERFVFFARAVLEALRPDPPVVLHVHDWQSALTVFFLNAQPHLYPGLSKIKSVLTVHNPGYQGLFRHQNWHLLNLDERFFTPRYLEFYGKINFLKGGLVFADAITTVSPTYAEEIKTAEHGFGLEGVFQERALNLEGILNGVDYHLWNPETDPCIAQNFSLNELSGKKACKVDLQQSFNLPQNDRVPLMGMVSRLTEQKGFDLLEKSLDELFTEEVQLVVLGLGDKHYQDSMSKAALRYSGKAGVRIAFEERLAHKVIAGCDMLLMPSRYEPGGLTQLYGLKYGTIPIVRATGGLKDTVKEFDPKTKSGIGFVFGPYEVRHFLDAVKKAIALYDRKDTWATVIRNAMAADFSWERSARQYFDLYRKLAAERWKPAS